jgi:hypothetical protein
VRIAAQNLECGFQERMPAAPATLWLMKPIALEPARCVLGRRPR